LGALLTPLSCYILTFNSQRRLAEVLQSLAGVYDDLVIIDSGSQDDTEAIVRACRARWVVRPFDNFAAQRAFAITQCRFEWVLQIDSDEVVSAPLRQRLKMLKESAFCHDGGFPDGFGIRREWYFLGQRVHCFYPSRCPDQPIRLFRKSAAVPTCGKYVHESLRVSVTAGIEEPLLHYTCDSIDNLYAKLNHYSTLAALNLKAEGIRSNWFKIGVFPWLIWAKWQFLYGGWRDGELALIHGRYVRDVIYQKYLKLKYDQFRK
jgi:glycosyltransferase involved in cell wall biosynthesis